MTHNADDCTGPAGRNCDDAAVASGFDCRSFRHTLGQFATGITVVTALSPDGQPVGLTVNSFAAVSLQPPLVLWSLAVSANLLESFRRASHYAINVLAADQEDISTRFATWPADRFAGLPWRPGHGGAPILEGLCAHFEVRNDQQYPGGDHLIFVGEVLRYAQNPERAPLLFHQGRYRLLGACD
jgi:flavin reductase (DIM6/NTAB) family NADH-FMN oxidoreductase RutF